MHVSSRSVTPSPIGSTTLNGAAHSRLQPSSILRQFVASGHATVAVEPRHDDLRQLTAWLETLPLATGEYSTARNRIHNASQYVRAGEFGAARYELRLVAGQLRQYLAD
jgi:hypothetical protein